MIEERFIETKLFNIQGYFKELEDVLAYSDQEIKKDFLKIRALERIF